MKKQNEGQAWLECMRLECMRSNRQITSMAKLRKNMMTDASELLTENDIAVSATSLMVKDYLKALWLINKSEVSRVLDLGCGFGGITKLVANFFSARESWGVDIDTNRLKVAEGRGLRTIRADIEMDKLPFSPNYFDLVISNGVIEHLRYYDNLISESHRVVKSGGHFLLSLPNLGNYIHRIALLLGYQPSDVEISKEIYVGTLYASGQHAFGHIHAATLKAVRQLLEHYGFTIVGVKKANPRIIWKYSNWSRLNAVLGYLCPTSLARRLIIIAKK